MISAATLALISAGIMVNTFTFLLGYALGAGAKK
jgi:hypothetical protein